LFEKFSNGSMVKDGHGRQEKGGRTNLETHNSLLIIHDFSCLVS